MSNKTILFTGGGSAGHVTPNIGIINELDKNKWDIHYIGSKHGIEKELILKVNVKYHSISTGKLRRYLTLENVKDLFRVMKGTWDARRLVRKINPAIVFSKGGFVSVPVVIAARSLQIPVYLHESDITPGLANKIAGKFATKIFTSFEEAATFFPSSKTKVVGSPIRRELFTGNKLRGLDWLRFDTKLPILTIMGGSLGARKINEVVRESLPELLQNFQVVHLCGKGNLDNQLNNLRGYKQFEYIHEELADILSATDYVVTRGGSNAIFEFLSLQIPMIIVPLSKSQSRGDQILNAKSFEEKGYSFVLEEENLTKAIFLDYMDKVKGEGGNIKIRMKEAAKTDALTLLVKEINDVYD